MNSIKSETDKHKGKAMEAQDIGNHHFGAVANACGFGQEFFLKQAGAAQIQSGTSRPDWQIYGLLEVTGWTPNSQTELKTLFARDSLLIN